MLIYSEANFGVMQNDKNLDVRVVVGEQYISEFDHIVSRKWNLFKPATGDFECLAVQENGKKIMLSKK